MLTCVLSSGLSNNGYTGAGFVCYAFFGLQGLGVANIYIALWTPVVLMLFFPVLRIRQKRVNNEEHVLSIKNYFDLTMLAVPAFFVALGLNLLGVAVPRFIGEFYITDIAVCMGAGLAFFAIGLQVNVRRIRQFAGLYFPVSAVKFFFTPVIAFCIVVILRAAGLDLTGLSQKVIIVQAFAPSAVLSVTMSTVFDLNGPLASSLWVVTNTIFLIVAVPVLFLVLCL